MFFIILLGCKEDSQKYKVFHYNQSNVINSLDPAFAKSNTNIWACNHLYNSLVRLDDSLIVRPSIAKKWEISDDGKKYTFHLRDDVYFHDDTCFQNSKGRKVLASDVQYSFERILDVNINSPGSWIFKGRVADDNAFVAVNDSTFIIHLKDVFRPFLGILAMKYCSVIPKEAVNYYKNEFRSNPVGTGALKFKRWIENQGLYLVKNENYFGHPVKYDGIKTSFISDRKIAFLEMMNGKLDFISGLESSLINDLISKEGELLPKHKDNLQFFKAPYLNTEYIGINKNAVSADHPLNNKFFRQALNYAIDRAQLLQLLRNNIGYPAKAGFIPRGLPSYDELKVNGYDFDLNKAQELLSIANVNLEVPIVIKTNNDYLDIMTFVARQWELLGVNVEIEVLESSVLRAGMRKGDIELFRASWIADYPDGENFLGMFYSKNPAPPNYTRFNNDKFDALFEEALSENNDHVRIKLYQQMDRILIEEAPVIFLFYDETALFYNKRIRNPSVNGINLLNVENLEIN